MNKQSDYNINLMNRLQEMQKDQLVISSITASFAKSVHKKQFENSLNQIFKEELMFNDLVILTANVDKQQFFYSSLVKENIDFETHSIDAYFEQCLQSAEPIIFYLKDVSEKKSALPSYFVNAKKLGMHTAIGFSLPYIEDNKNVIFLFYKNAIEFNGRLERILRGISTQLSITIRNILITEKLDTFQTRSPSAKKDVETVKCPPAG